MYCNANDSENNIHYLKLNKIGNKPLKGSFIPFYCRKVEEWHRGAVPKSYARVYAIGQE